MYIHIFFKLTSYHLACCFGSGILNVSIVKCCHFWKDGNQRKPSLQFVRRLFGDSSFRRGCKRREIAINYYCNKFDTSSSIKTGKWRTQRFYVKTDWHAPSISYNQCSFAYHCIVREGHARVLSLNTKIVIFRFPPHSARQSFSPGTVIQSGNFSPSVLLIL